LFVNGIVPDNIRFSIISTILTKISRVNIFQADYYITDIAGFCMKMVDAAGSGLQMKNIWFGKERKSSQLLAFQMLTYYLIPCV
jgi:hypothetical protein